MSRELAFDGAGFHGGLGFLQLRLHELDLVKELVDHSLLVGYLSGNLFLSELMSPLFLPSFDLDSPPSLLVFLFLLLLPQVLNLQLVDHRLTLESQMRQFKVLRLAFLGELGELAGEFGDQKSFLVKVGLEGPRDVGLPRVPNLV